MRTTILPSLAQLIQASANRVSNVIIEVDSAMGTVCIRDGFEEQDDIFMQGDDAERFIERRNALYEEVQVLDKNVIERHLAEPYIECIWG